LLTSYGYSNIATDEYFSYTRENLFEKVLGTLEQGYIIKITSATFLPDFGVDFNVKPLQKLWS
jgi:hypothetical protein